MDDWVEVGVFGEGEPYIEKQRIRSGQQTITVEVPRKPTRAGIATENLLIKPGHGDHIEGVKIEN